MCKVVNIKQHRIKQLENKDKAHLCAEIMRIIGGFDFDDMTTAVQQCDKVMFLNGLLLSVVSGTHEQHEINKQYALDLQGDFAKGEL